MTAGHAPEFTDGFELGRLDPDRWVAAYLPHPGSAAVGMGVHPHRDPRLQDDFGRVPLAIDVGEPHDYAVEWAPDGITWEVDGRAVRSSPQSPAYPKQLMLGIYAFGPVPAGAPARRFVVEHVRGYPPARGRVA